MRILLSAAFLSILLLTTQAFAADIDEWETTPDGHIVITYRTIDKDGVHFKTYKYAVVGSPAKVPECNEAQVKGKRLYLLTRESFPMGYVVDLQDVEMLGKRFDPQPKTFGGWVR